MEAYKEYLATDRTEEWEATAAMIVLRLTLKNRRRCPVYETSFVRVEMEPASLPMSFVRHGSYFSKTD